MILNLRGGTQVEYYSFALTDMVKWGYGNLRNIQGQFGEVAVRGIPAIARAARIRSEALASLQLKCWRGEGPLKKQVDGAWQSGLFADDPNEWQTRFGFWETVGESLAYRNNAYIWKLVDPNSYRVIDWYALHPDQVACKGQGRYEVTINDGYIDPVGRGPGKYKVDYTTILHVRGHGNGGTWEAPSPIKVFRDALAAPIARQRYEEKMWNRGTSLQLGIEFPGGVKKAEAEEWKEGFENRNSGLGGDTTAVVGGGAKLVPISMTMADAQFVEMAHLTIEDASLIMGVPANLLGTPSMSSKTRLLLEEDLMTWLRFGLGPELERIESALAGDDTLFPSLGRSIYPQFDTEAFVRGDIMTEDNVAHQRVQDGRLLVDEWRATQGLPPLPPVPADGGNQRPGMIPQVVPVGGGPNPTPNPGVNGKAPKPLDPVAP